MSIRSLSAAILMLSTSLVLAQNTPPAGGPSGGQGERRMGPTERFKELDKNADGKLSLEEMTAAMAGRVGGTGREGAPASNPPSAQGAAQAVPMAERFKAADADKDGSLSATEFTAMMQSMRQSGGRSAGGMGGGQ